MAPYDPSLIEREPGHDWRQLQDRVSVILSESGMKTEVAKRLRVARGEVEVDVYAVDPTTQPNAVYICECKRWRSRVPQSQVQAFRTIIGDSGAHFGLFISAEGFQAGAFEVVRYTNSHLVNWRQFQALFAERWCKVHFTTVVRSECKRLASYAEMPGNDAILRYSHGEPIDEAEAIGLMVNSYWSPPFMDLGIAYPASEPLAGAIWRERDEFLPFLPSQVAKAVTLRDLLDALITFARAWRRTRESGQTTGVRPT